MGTSRVERSIGLFNREARPYRREPPIFRGKSRTHFWRTLEMECCDPPISIYIAELTAQSTQDARTVLSDSGGRNEQLSGDRLRRVPLDHTSFKGTPL